QRGGMRWPCLVLFLRFARGCFGLINQISASGGKEERKTERGRVCVCVCVCVCVGETEREREREREREKNKDRQGEGRRPDSTQINEELFSVWSLIFGVCLCVCV